MNTINIFIKNSGSVAELKKDFALFAGSYQNKLIDVYVPTEILYSNEQGTFNNAVKIGAELTAPNGSTITTNPYYLSYIKTVELPNPLDSSETIEYAVYERQLPKEFSVYAGTQTLVVNVISIDNTVNPAVVLQVVTTQRCSLLVQPSSYISDEPIEEPSELESLEARVTTNETNIIEIQDILEIQDIDGENDSARLVTMENSIETNANDIADLQQQIAHQDNYIGQIEVVTLVGIDDVLDQFVEDTTGASAVNGDVVIVVLDVNGQKTNYRYTYTAEGWQGFQISQTNLAQNNVYGVIKGTYNTGSTNNVIIDASAGQITDIYYKNGASYYGVATDLANVKNRQDNIVAGTQAVGLAEKSVADQNGDVIDLTYAKADDVYTKDESDEKFLPKSYSNVYYYSQDGIVDEVPTSPASGIQFTEDVEQVGEVEFFDCRRTLQQEYNFNKNSTDQSGFWVFTDTDCVLSFRLVTSIVSGGTEYVVASDLTGEVTFTANVPQLININTIYSGLGNTSLETNAGDVFKKVLYVTPANNVATEVNLYSNVQYPSSFQLSTQNVNFNINVINGIAQVNIQSSEWEDNGDNTYSVVIHQSRHQQAPSNQYIMQLQTEVSSGNYQYIAFTPQVDLNGDITLTTLEALDCDLLIASGTSKDARGILTLTNPTELSAIDYSESGALKITQSIEPTNLTLPNPTDVGVFYTFMVANDPSSTQPINVNGEVITAGDGIQFKWVGAWITGEEPTDTTEVYDSANQQTLNLTLASLQNSINGLTTGKQDALNSTQLDAVNSGANATNIAQIGTNTTAISGLQSGKQDALSAEQLTAVNSGVDASVVAQVGTNTNDIGAIQTAISVLPTMQTTLAGKSDKDIAYSAKRETGLSVGVNDDVVVGFDLPLYNDNSLISASGNAIVLSEAHPVTVKYALNFSGTAPASGDIVVTLYDGVASVKTKTISLSHNDTLPQIADGVYLTSATRNLTLHIEHTFDSAILMTAESGISIQAVDGNKKVSASDNAFDIEYGVRWIKDFANNTITLK